MQKEDQLIQTQITKQQFQNLQLNKNGRPKQKVILFQLTPQIKEQAQLKISKDINLIPQNQYNKIIKQSAKIWDKFYKNHKCNFFKDRKYLQKQIPQLTILRQKYQATKQSSVFVELGCGVGNTFFPIHQQFQFMRIYGCDFASSAIKLINQQINKNKPKFDRIKVTTCDLVKQQIPAFFEKGDLVTLVFVLSAIDPLEHLNVIQKIYKWMKPNSYLYFRDYGRYDFGQLNMTRKGNRKLKDNFYAKNDGVCVYYFEQEQIIQMCEKVGFKKIQMVSHCKLLQNRKTGLKMYRIWLQGRFYKPAEEYKINNFQEQKIQVKMQQTQKAVTSLKIQTQKIQIKQKE